MPKKAPEEPKPLRFATPNPWSALPREVHVGTGHGKKEGATTESPVDGQDQPKIYTIRDHTLEVLMHPDVLELHAVRVVHTPHGDERQLHLKVRVRCGREEKVVDVLVDTGAQVSLVRRGLFKEELLQPSRRPVRLKVANGEIMGGGTHEATISMEFWEHERLNRPDQAKRSTLSGNFYVADITDWDMIMGYDFMVANAIGALPHRATLVREDDECLTWLSTDYACGSSQWNAAEEDRIVQAVQAVGAKSRGDRGVQLTEYGMAPQVYDRMIQTLGAEAPETDVFASRDAPLLRKCRRHWHRGDSAWHRHWGLKEWGPMYWHGSLDNTRRTVEKIIADRAKGILVITGIGSTPCPLEGLKSTLDSITLNEMSFGPEEELFIDAKGVSMPSPGQAWGTKAFLPGKLASLHHWEKPQTISELRSFMGFCNYYSGYVRMYAELSGPLHKMLQVGKFDGRKGSKKKLAWTPEAEDAFNSLKERLLGQLGLFLVDPDKGFVLRTDASDYAVGAVLEQVRDDATHVPVAFWSRILAEGQRRTWTTREKETYAIVCALRKWSGHIGLQPVVVCTDHQSLQSWHKEHVDTPSGPAARRARWHESFAKFDLSVVYVPGKDNTVADCLSRWAYPAGKAWMNISSHGDAEETEEAKRIIEMEKVMEQEGVKCFVVMANRTDLAKFRGARVQAIREETLEQWMVAPVELVRSVLTEDWSDDYAASEHWSKYWNAVSAPSDDEWPEGLTEDGDKLFLKDKLLVPENRVEELIDHWHNAQLMHPGRDKMQQDLEWRFKFPPGYYAILDRYCSDCAVCRATKSPNHSTAGNPVYTAIPEAPMRSVAMDVFAMPEVTVEGETYDCVILAVDRHSGYIVAVPGKKSKKKDKKDKHGVGLQAKTVANAMIRHWLTIFDVPAVICSDQGSQFVGTWFKTMCKHMGIRHAKTVAYHSRSNGRAEVAGRQMFEKFRQLHIDEPGRNWYNSLWRVLQAYHDLPGPTGLSPHRILFLRDRV